MLIGGDVGAAAAFAAECVVKALSGEGETRSVALAGGRTPAGLYEALARPPWREDADWGRVAWFWGDERAVSPDHPDSNYRMAREKLLDPLGIKSDHIHRMRADVADPGWTARAYERLIRELIPAGESGIPALDLVILGVGADGHTASLFPGSPGLGEARRLVVAHKVPSLGAWRMTLTLPLLRAARHILFFVTGSDKAEVVGRIFAGEADPMALPAAGLREHAGTVTWVLDEPAASCLPSQA